MMVVADKTILCISVLLAKLFLAWFIFNQATLVHAFDLRH
jgi:hypothetical protein